MADAAAAEERAVLAALILDPLMVPEVEQALDPDDFGDLRHEAIYRALAAQYRAGAPTSVAAVVDRLDRDSTLRQAGGEAYLWEVAGEVYTSSGAPFHAEAVHRRALKRRLAEVAATVRDLATGEGDAYEAAERAAAEVARVLSRRRAAVRAVGEEVDLVVDSLATPPRYVPSPWPSINRLIGGWRPGALYVIGARPGSGKTIMGLQAAAALASQGPVGYSSLEMDAQDLTTRLLSLRGGIRMTDLTNHSLTEHQWRKVAEARPYIAGLPLYIDDRAGVGVAHVRTFARATARRGRLAGLVVDYLQLLRPADPRKPRWESVGEMSGALKALARELEVPVVALCQLNRGTEGVRRAPSLGDLRESGSIEQDADVVLLLQREVEESTGEPGDSLTVAVAKNRHGSTGLTSLNWEGYYARVTDPTDTPPR